VPPAPAVAVCLAVLVAILALAVDGGLLMTDRRHAQAAADAAALAAAADLYQQQVTNPSNPGIDGAGGTARASAFTTAAADGYAKPAVTVNLNPDKYAEGPNAGTQVPPGYAEAIVLGSQSRGFSGIFGSGGLAVHARAVAKGIVRPYSAAGIILLDPTGKGAYRGSGNGAVRVTGGASAIIDSDNPAAARMSGSASLSAANIDVTGGSSRTGAASIQGRVTYGVPPTPDPLITLPAPDKAKLPVTTSTSAGRRAST